MKSIDRDALRRCVEQYCHDARRAQRFKERGEEGESWEKRALSACYSVQMDNMQLPPWGAPPCWAHGAAMKRSAFEIEQVKARHLADRMLANGLSAFF
jgi:hypothetical protein